MSPLCVSLGPLKDRYPRKQGWGFLWNKGESSGLGSRESGPRLPGQSRLVYSPSSTSVRGSEERQLADTPLDNKLWFGGCLLYSSEEAFHFLIPPPAEQFEVSWAYSPPDGDGQARIQAPYPSFSLLSSSVSSFLAGSYFEFESGGSWIWRESQAFSAILRSFLDGLFSRVWFFSGSRKNAVYSGMQFAPCPSACVSM